MTSRNLLRSTAAQAVSALATGALIAISSNGPSALTPATVRALVRFGPGRMPPNHCR